MKRSMALVIWLVAAWLALWRDVNFANVVSGLTFAIILVVAFPVGRTSGPDRSPVGPRSGWRGAGFTLRPWPALKFVVYFAGKVVQANVIVAWQVVRPSRSVIEGIVAVQLHTRVDGLATMVADAVTLTPGTMTIDIDRPTSGPITLFIHALQLGDPDDLRSETWVFEAMILAAFGDPSELDNPVDASPTRNTDAPQPSASEDRPGDGP